MAERKIGAGARVIVTLEVLGCGSWGSTCTVEQVHKQAAEAAVGRVRQMIEARKEIPSIKIIGVPRVTGVFTEDE